MLEDFDEDESSSIWTLDSADENPGSPKRTEFQVPQWYNRSPMVTASMVNSSHRRNSQLLQSSPSPSSKSQKRKRTVAQEPLNIDRLASIW